LENVRPLSKIHHSSIIFGLHDKEKSILPIVSNYVAIISWCDGSIVYLSDEVFKSNKHDGSLSVDGSHWN
jgi:hypothetical protein